MTHVVFLHSSSEMYGSDRSLRSIVRAAVAAGHRVSVVLPDDGPLVAELEAVGTEVRRIPVAVLRRSLLSPRGLAQFAGNARAAYTQFRWVKDAAQNEPVSLVSNTSAVVTGAILARRWRLPHTVIVREFYKPGLERAAFERIVASASGIVCVSKAVAAQFTEATRARAVVVHSGADMTHPSAQPQRDGTDDAVLRILCPGRLNAWKGQDVLVSALGIVAASGVRFHARIVGGEYGSTTTFAAGLKTLIEAAEIGDSVELVGELPGLDPEYSWSDVVVVPSKRAEPFGKVVIEGMNSSRVVVATDLGGPAEVIADGKTGLLVPADDPAALAAALLRLTEPAVRAEIGERAHAGSLNFDAAASAARIVEIVA